MKRGFTPPAMFPFKHFIVGGAVRDYILGVEPKDIDIVTPLSPQEVMSAVSAAGIRFFPKGLSFGVVSLLIEGREYEVASFRSEWISEDAAHCPEGMRRVGTSIKEDLSRRDFTINAMAMAADGEIIDPFGGREDLSRGVIRAVGNPVERLHEDPLRGFRACRFAARYGFEIDPYTLDAIRNNVHLVSRVSVERVRNELEKILLSPHPSIGLQYLVDSGLIFTVCRVKKNGKFQTVNVLPELGHLNGLEQNPRYHRFDVWGHTLAVTERIPADLALRWAALLHDVAKGLPGVRGLNKRGEISDHNHDKVGAELVKKFLSRLRVQPAIARRVVWLIREHMSLPDPSNEKAVRRWLIRLSSDFTRKSDMADAVSQLLALRRADLLAGKIEPELSYVDDLARLTRRLIDDLPFFPADLLVGGRDLISAGFTPGSDIGKILLDLVRRVQQGLENDKTVLLAAAQKAAARRAKKQSDNYA